MAQSDIERQMAQLLASAHHAPGARFEDRVISATAAVPPARPHSHRRLVFAAVGLAVAVLIALGVVPSLTDHGGKAWARALAKAAQAKTVHYVGYGWSGTGRYEIEQWVDRPGGFSRYEERQNGVLLNLQMWDGNDEVRYNALTEQERKNPRLYPSMRDGKLVVADLSTPIVHETYIPTFLGQDPTTFAYRDRMATMFFSLLDKDSSTIKVSSYSEEQQQTSAGEVTVIEMEGQGMAIYGGGRRVLESMRVHAEVNTATNDLMLLQIYHYNNRTWELSYEVQAVDWNTPIPQEARRFDPPKGTKLIRNMWWEKRSGQALARAANKYTEMTLHAVDVNERGDIFLSLSSTFKDEPLEGTLDSMKVTDDTGTTYRTRGGCSYIGGQAGAFITKQIMRDPDAKTPLPHKISIELYAFDDPKAKDQLIQFNNIPLPPRQPGIDLPYRAREEIQY